MRVSGPHVSFPVTAVLLFLLLPVGASPSSPAQEAAPQTLTGSFQAISGRRMRVLYRGQDSLRAVWIREFLEGIGPLGGLPDSLPSGVTLFLARSPEVFDSLTGGAIPEWGAGVAIPSRGWIVMPGFGSQRTRGWSEARVLRHEWAHLALHQFAGSLRAPRWFDEGYAEWASGGWTPGEGWRLRVAFALGRAPPLDSLALDWPRDRASAQLAYLLSATAVEYLVQESGERGLRVFLERWREEESFPRAFLEVYGVTLGQFEEDWKGYVKRRYGWLFVLSHSTVFWLILTFALLVMVRIRRGRNREAMARLRATEPPEAPAYWQDPGEGTDASSEGLPPEGSPSVERPSKERE